MGGKTLRETILEILEQHVKNNGIIMGECVRGPECGNYAIPVSDNVIDIPMSETAGSDFAVGCALAGRRTVFVVKYQDFMLLGGSPFITFSSVVKGIQGVTAPVFIRALSADYYDSNHSNVLHSMFMHHPGFYVCAPMTPNEYKEAWRVFMTDDKPFYCSEYRDAYDRYEEMHDEINEEAVINVFCISKARMNINKAKDILRDKGVKINIFHITWLKPLDILPKYIEYLEKCPLGLVVDAGRVICGAPEHIAYELMHKVKNSRVYALGIEDEPKSTNPNCFNEVPTGEKIANKIMEIINENSK